MQPNSGLLMFSTAAGNQLPSPNHVALLADYPEAKLVA